MKGARTIAGYVLVGMLGFSSAHVFRWFDEGRATTVTRLSPDETTRARLVEVSPGWAIDRNFAIRLDDLVAGTTSTIFRSPDQAHGEGTERLIWSKDGTKLLLAGRHFFVKDDLFLDNGDQAYFLYDVPTGKGWCNADFPTSFPPLMPGLIEGVEFTEPIKLKMR